LWLACVALLSLLPSASLAAAAPVRVFDTHGSATESEWTVVSGTPLNLNPRHIVLDNGLIRVAHPPASSSEKAGHVLYVKVAGSYRLAGDSEFGDWTYTGSSFTDLPSRFTILENRDQVARIRLSFDSHRHEYQENSPLPVQKTIVLHQAAWGYRAILEVPSDLPGEREVGFGGTSTHLLSFTQSTGILWNPFQPPPAATTDGTDYVWLRNEGQPKGNWWAASLPFDNSYYRLVALRATNPAGLRTGQFSGGHTGHLIHWAYEGFSSYEAFVAAVPYNASMARRVTVQNGSATVHVPRVGTYNLMTRKISGRRHTYVTVKAGLKLNPGYNKVDVRGLSLYAPIIVPVSNGMNLPGDIARPYQEGRLD
jgi:hypothetical protein